MGSYKEALLAVLDRLTCSHCREIFTNPVTLGCRDSVCLLCAEKIGSKSKKGLRCCCPKCGVKSVTKDLSSRINRTLLDVAAVARGHAASLGKGRSTHSISSAGDSGIWDLMSEYSFGSSCSISSMGSLNPPNMASKRELFDRMFLITDGLESEGEFSQRPSGSSVCSERKQRSKDETSARRSLSRYGRYLFRRLFKSKLLQQRAPSRAHSLDSLTHVTSYGTLTSVYKLGWHKQALLAVLEPLKCPHCMAILTSPVTLDCGHSVCWDCARKTGSKNKEGQRCCCCPKCGAESVTEDLFSRVNRTLLSAVVVVHRYTASLWKGGSVPEACSAGDSESGVGDLRSEGSIGSSWSISSMKPPPTLAS